MCCAFPDASSAVKHQQGSEIPIPLEQLQARREYSLVAADVGPGVLEARLGGGVVMRCLEFYKKSQGRLVAAPSLRRFVSGLRFALFVSAALRWRERLLVMRRASSWWRGAAKLRSRHR